MDKSVDLTWLPCQPTCLVSSPTLLACLLWQPVCLVFLWHFVPTTSGLVEVDFSSLLSYISMGQVYNLLASCVCTVVGQLTHDPMFQGLNLHALCTCREKIVKTTQCFGKIKNVYIWFNGTKHFQNCMLLMEYHNHFFTNRHLLAKKSTLHLTAVRFCTTYWKLDICGSLM